MKQVNKEVFNAADNASSSGMVIDANQLIAASFQVVDNSTDAAGAVKVQYSNDINTGDQKNFVPTNWSDIPSATVTLTGGGVASIPMPTQICFRWLKVVWTRSGGGAANKTMKVRMFAQSV